MRHRIEVQQITEVQDAYGDTSPAETGNTAWTTAETRWAAVEPLVGREYLKADAEGSKATHWVRMRAMPTITPKFRLKWGTRIFNIISAQNIDERDRETRILCEEVLT